ncbi:GTA TIM barrel-like domain protein [Rhodobacter phage RcSimone-Hastad]|nr:GTA TIM barrel-like domain protein [Rhodobacter phage RcSimone-Hastad]
MATYVLGAIGTALGGPIGGMIGAALGGLADRLLIGMLTPGTHTTNTGPRLTEMSLTTSTEGAVIPKVFGRSRFGGQVIWTAQFKEHEKTETEDVGGKGGPSTEVTTVSYSYTLSFAVAFCAGNRMAHLGRVWIDSVETDISKFNFKFYPGSESQSADPTMEAIEGAGNVPAYRGVSYIVFEDLPLGDYGNRLPQVTAEIVVPLDTNDADDLSLLGRSWQLIPATGEHIYGTQKYTRQVTEDGETVKITENMHNNFNKPDVEVSLDILEAVQPNLDAVSVVVSWFGTDLRVGNCSIIPKIEGTDRTVEPTDWAVAGYTRGTAQVVSYDDKGNPIFGGTPSDVTVRELVQEIKARGQRVMFYPFILMDIPSGNTLPNPYSNNAATNGQPIFPWRGRITCSPAAGYTGTVDKTATAATQVNNFFNGAQGYRAMILHYANLLDDLLGANDAFIIGSELVGITQIRSSAGAGTYPGVNALVTLAADVSAILPSSVKVGYAADWSEYHSHRPADGTNDVIFNMDPLWASSNIDFIGIDNYLPMSDWRDGSDHLDYDAVNGPVSIYDRNYLKSNIEGGEYYDWYYASDAARNAQTRTPIVDGNPANEPWVFRQKDIRNWWATAHRHRPGGVRNAGTTSYVPSTKPIWFTEFGAPAIDKATNQPNVFYDPKSSESFFPYHSKGTRDDAIQRLYLECFLQYWRDTGGSMVSIQNCFIWTWDARPFPAYPMRTDVWSDGVQWVLGHWLSGRIDGAVLPRLVKKLCLDSGLTGSQIDVEGLYGPECIVRGLVIGSQTSSRDILQSLAEAYEFKGFESAGQIKFVMDINQKTTELPVDDLVLAENATAPVKITRGQETELPRMVNLSFMDELNAYQPASVSGLKGTGSSQNQTSVDFPLVWTDDHARAVATSMLFKAWAAREKGEFNLPPSYARMDVGDLVYVPVGSRAVAGQLSEVTDSTYRMAQFIGFDLSLLTSPGYQSDIKLPEITAIISKVILQFMNIPLALTGEPSPHSMRLAAGASDGAWPGGVNVLRSDGAGGFLNVQTVSARSSMATLTSPLYSGPTQVWDRNGEVYVTMLSGGLSSLTEAQLLAGSLNAAAIQNSVTGEWEVFQFATAELLGIGSYKLKNLIRGQLGTEHVMRNPYPAGTRVVFISTAAVVPLAVSKSVAMANTTYRWGPSNRPTNDDLYVNGARQGTLAGLRPYAPCDFQVVRNSANDNLELTWKRRTRLGGDNWDAIEVPLSEETEQYKLEIYNDAGTTLKRTVVLASPNFTYTAADQTADHGSVQTDVYVKVYQFGGEYGNYGPPLAGMFYMKGSI